VKVKKELLSPEEKTILAGFVNSEYWPVYRKVQKNTIRNIEKVAISANDMEELQYYRGRVYQINLEISDFTRNFNKVDENKRKNQIKAKK
jgi:hypothetical protein